MESTGFAMEGLNEREVHREEVLEEGIQFGRECLAEGGQTDMGAEDFREHTTWQVLNEALRGMADDYGVHLSAEERHAARTVIPTVAEFAQLVSGRYAVKKDQNVWQLAVAWKRASEDETTGTELIVKDETVWTSPEDHVKL